MLQGLLGVDTAEMDLDVSVSTDRAPPDEKRNEDVSPDTSMSEYWIKNEGCLLSVNNKRKSKAGSLPLAL